MKTWRKLGAAAACGLVMASVAGLRPAMAQVKDDFNDGNDAGWSKYDLTAVLNGFGIPGTYADYTYPADSGGGKAYRIRAYAPPVGDAGPGRAFSYQSAVYSRLRCAVDLLDWNSTPDPAFGILFRANSVGIGTTAGYVFNYNSGDLDLQINKVEGEAEAGTIAEIHLPLDPAKHDYRMVLTTYGPNLLGQLFQLPDTANPIASVVATDSTTADGKVGLFSFDRDTKLADVGQKVVVTDTTFDNFAAEVPPVGSLGAVAIELAPRPGSEVRTAQPQIRAAVLNRETAVNASSLELTVDGVVVPSGMLQVVNEVVVPNNAVPFEGATVSYTPGAALNPGAHTVRLVFADDKAERRTNIWTFTATFLDNPAGTGKDRGFNVRVVQGTQEATLGNSLARAEAQLAPDSTIPKLYDTNVTASVINYSQKAITPGETDGNFTDDAPVPGQTEGGGTDNWAMEVLTWLDLPAGTVKLGVNSDDGYRISSDSLPGANKVLAERDGGTANNETTELYVAKAGLYPFRFLWYENGGGAHVEWFSVNANGDRVLLNAEGGIKAYRTLVAASGPVVQSATTVNGQYTLDTTAVVDAAQKRITLPIPAVSKFYRLSGTTATKINNVKIQASDLVMTYE